MKESLASRQTSSYGKTESSLDFICKEDKSVVVKTSIENLDQLLAKLEHELYISAHLKGYLYIRTAVNLSLADPDVVTSVTKLLYPDIAKKYSTTPEKVERSIRNAIEISWSKGNPDLQEKIFGYNSTRNKKRPTNSLFIASIADYIRLYFSDFLKAD